MLPTECRICKESFSSNRELNKHIRTHKLTQASYYEEYHPRKCHYSWRNIPFTNIDQYFSTFFLSENYREKFFTTKRGEKAKRVALEMLTNRIETKEHNHAPSSLEIKSLDLPSIAQFSELFGSYGRACKEAGISMLFSGRPSESFYLDHSEEKILIDTREQKPLNFKNSETVKLDVGDYTLPRNKFTNTFVDRKSESDFKGTFASDISRFKKELERCRTLKCFLWVVVECEFEDLKRNNLKYGKKTSSNLSYVYHNLRNIQHCYSDCCQIVFTGSRERSEFLIPRLLVCGKELWNCDMQYFFEKI